ncbi:helix-hairpin-helix domain-containing protein [Umezawaea tangerina]|uniref:helix-hairpin-helix domain-containing protein n=1 Tax=Umezawaea tangerina TaxID=84725 RepID=UPI001B804328|nr:helix-hairpin-helix domain-containing protein [Umezawaea tangerina]
MDLPADLSAPARRALVGAGYTTVEQLASATRRELLALHGFGPKALGPIRRDLAALGLDLAEG